MRKINLVDYTVPRKVPDNMNPAKWIEILVPYIVKDSLINLMFTRELQLGGVELVRQNVLAMKIEACKEPEVILEEDEWQRLEKALKAFKGYSRDDVELVRRIFEAEQIK